MSEADSPNKEPELPESLESSETVAGADTDSDVAASANSPTSDEDWQTLNFPGAINLDAIPFEAESLLNAVPSDLMSDPKPEAAPTAMTESRDPAETTPAVDPLLTQIEQLRQENAELHDRLAQLEQDLLQGQIQWQLEAAQAEHAQASHQEAVAAESHSTMALIQQELAAAQERVSTLFQELERSHQTSQRQQILVETFTEQLGSSQERIAQLERECALTQQRYNEQVQQVLQAENTCRDLRMRLHRQQQHTLQFKAALEKCLEMPTYRQNQFMPDFEPEDTTSVAFASTNALSRVLPPKNQPVKPWSAPLVAAPIEVDLSSSNFVAQPLPNLLQAGAMAQPEVSVETGATDLSQSTTDELTAALLAGDTRSVTDLMQTIFPDDSASLPPTPIAADAANAIFDLSPFLAAEAAPTNYAEADEELMQLLNAVPLESGASSPAIEAASAESTSELPDESLWDQLAQVIDPVSPVENPIDTEASSSSTASAEADSLVEADDRSVSTPDVTPEVAPAVAAEAPSARKPLEPLNWAFQSNKLPNRGAQVVASTVAAGRTMTTTATLNYPSSHDALAIAGDAFTGGWPSPVVYPLRSPKKLASLAAVELPTFPRPR